MQNEVSGVSRQSLHENIWMVPPLGHDHFFHLTSQFSFANNTNIYNTLSDTRLFALRACTWAADKSLARPWKETSYSDQDLQHNTKTYSVQTTEIYSFCFYVISLGIVL